MFVFRNLDQLIDEFCILHCIYFRFRMKPEPRIVKKPSGQFEPHAEEKHVMMYQRKAKSDKKLGKTKKKLAERKKALRAEASKNETEKEKEMKRKKETERKISGG